MPWPAAPRMRGPSVFSVANGSGIGIDGMQREALLQPFDDLRPLRADQRYFDLFRHARSPHHTN